MSDDRARGKDKSVFRSLVGIFPRKDAVRPAASPPDREAIETWLINRIASILELDPNQIDVRESFTSFALDSRTAVSLSGDLEKWLGRRLSPTLVWDYPSIEQLAQYLSDPTTGEEPAPIDEESIPGLSLPARKQN
jgi:acyl carrier protein